MRRIALALCLLLAPLTAQAQETGSEGAIHGVISGQIDAFRLDDLATAFTFASPGIQSMFRTPENFGAMVRNGYPMVWRPDRLRFGPQRSQGGVIWQQVIVTDAQGRAHVLDYRMEQVDGQWRIAGVQILAAPEVSA